MLIYWPYIRRIEETGSRIDCLITEHRKKIRSYSHALRQQCEAMLNKSKPERNGRRPVTTTNGVSPRPNGVSPRPEFSSPIV